MGRSPCCDNPSLLTKGAWTPQEDQKLAKYIQENGHESWRSLPKLAGLSRCGKSCRLRWTNYLRPDIKRGTFSVEEERTILELHSVIGNKWSAIASQLPGRTDNEIKNFWNTRLKKKLIKMGFDPVTHQPRNVFSSLQQSTKVLENVKEIMEQYTPWAGHDAGIQNETEAQIAMLAQYLHRLLQAQVSTYNEFDLSAISGMMCGIHAFGLSGPYDVAGASPLGQSSDVGSIDIVGDGGFLQNHFTHLPYHSTCAEYDNRPFSYLCETTNVLEPSSTSPIRSNGNAGSSFTCGDQSSDSDFWHSTMSDTFLYDFQ